MSATDDAVQTFIKQHCNLQTMDYKLKADYGHIRKLEFFHHDENMEALVKQCIANNQKAIVFIQSAQEAYRLYRKYQTHCLFNCSKHNRKYMDKVDRDKISKMLVNQKFEELILITTLCLDAGVNIVDTDLHIIIIDAKDIDVLTQAAGRKRSQGSNDYLELYIKVINNQQLAGLESSANRKIEMARYLKENGTEAFLEKYIRHNDVDDIVYDDNAGNGLCTKHVNELRLFKKERDIKMLREKYGEFGYCKYIAKKFGFYDETQDRYNYTIMPDNIGLESYLRQNVGKPMLTKNDRRPLINLVNLRRNGKLITGLSTLDAFIRDSLGLPYTIREFETSRRSPVGEKKNYKHAWTIYRLEPE
jgi:hypothetical protein